MSTQRRKEKSAPSCGREKEGVRFGSSFYTCFFCFVLFFPGPVLCKLGQPGVLIVLPEVLTLVLGPSFVLFSWAFSLHCLLATAVLDSFSLF